MGWPDPSFGVFCGLTLFVSGFAAFMTGQGVATTWRPLREAVIYVLLLGCADRFLAFALFGGTLLSPVAYMVDTAALMVIALVAFRMARVRKMTLQYPWLYERTGLFSWRARGEG